MFRIVETYNAETDSETSHVHDLGSLGDVKGSMEIICSQLYQPCSGLSRVSVFRLDKIDNPSKNKKHDSFVQKELYSVVCRKRAKGSVENIS